MPKFLEVTRNQLSCFVTGGKYGGPPAEIPEGMEHCPLTNLLGENVFGHLDYDMGHRRHSSLHHRSTTLMMQHNRTAQWLSKKSHEDFASLMTFARKKGPGLRKQHRQQERIIRLKLQERRAENERRKLQKSLQLAELKAAIIRRLREHGGPCGTSADVDSLLQRLRHQRAAVIVEALKDEIRYHKTVLGLKHLRLGGSQQELVERLKNHLNQVDPEPARPEDDVNDHEALELEEDAQVELPLVEAVERDTAALDEEFSFQQQTQWVAVFFDDDFYIGQVLDIKDKDTAVVTYLERARKKQGSLYRWPAIEDISETAAQYVFRWSLDVMPVANSGRLWHVDDIEDIEEGYAEIKSRV